MHAKVIYRERDKVPTRLQLVQIGGIIRSDKNAMAKCDYITRELNNP